MKGNPMMAPAIRIVDAAKSSHINRRLETILLSINRMAAAADVIEWHVIFENIANRICRIFDINCT
jgi:hypothetical protein